MAITATGPGQGMDPGQFLLNSANSQTANQGYYAQQLAKVQGGYANQQAQTAAQAQVKASAQQAAAVRAAAQSQAEASKFGSSSQLAGVQAQLGQSQSRFNQLFPYFQGLTGGLTSGGGASGGSYGGPGGGNYGIGSSTPASSSSSVTPAPYQAAGNYGYGGGGGGSGPSAPSTAAPQVGAPPTLGALAPAISDAQLNQNINLNAAQNWAQAGGLSRRQTNQLAGGGLGATSPLAKALQAQVFGGALAANTAGATTARDQAAQLNANQALGAYQAKAGAQASEYGSQQQALAALYGSQVGAQASEYGSQQQAQAARLAAQLGAQSSQYGSQVGAQASQYGSQLDYQAALAAVSAQKQNALLAALASFSA